jgi:hypothetical protein
MGATDAFLHVLVICTLRFLRLADEFLVDLSIAVGSSRGLTASSRPQGSDYLIYLVDDFLLGPL